MRKKKRPAAALPTAPAIRGAKARSARVPRPHLIPRCKHRAGQLSRKEEKDPRCHDAGDRQGYVLKLSPRRPCTIAGRRQSCYAARAEKAFIVLGDALAAEIETAAGAAARGQTFCVVTAAPLGETRRRHAVFTRPCVRSSSAAATNATATFAPPSQTLAMWAAEMNMDRTSAPLFRGISTACE